MKDTDIRELRRRFARQYGLVSRDELRALGVDRALEQRRIASGEWERLGKRTIRLSAAPSSAEQRLLAACIEGGAGAIASHQSAAWMSDLVPPPERHAITIPRSRVSKISWAAVHRLGGPAPAPVHRRGIPVTNPLRTLVDFAAVVDEVRLDAAIDRALAKGLVTVPGILAEIERLESRGRSGVGAMRKALRRRGLVGGPNPSVLESRILRLLHNHRIPVLATEVWVGEDGRYRVDAALTDELMVEVDGYAYHHTPEQKAEDERRRNRIRLSGRFLLVYTWRDVVYDSGRVIAEIRRALTQPSIEQLTGAVQRPPVL